MTDTLRASEQGLEIVELARRRKGWTRTSSPIWWQQAHVSRATLRRFWRGIAIASDNFIAICEAVGIRNWQAIVDNQPEVVDEILEELYRRATTEEPALPPQKTVLISYSDRDPSLNLAREFYQALRQAGHQAVLAGDEQQQGFTWTQRLDTALQRSDYLLLLLYERAARSEMVAEAVRRATEIQAERRDRKLNILPLCFSSAYNGDLNSYLQRIPQPLWNLENSSQPPIQEVLALIDKGESWEPNSLSPSPSPRRPIPPSPHPPELELPGGQVPLTSRFYIPRPPLESLALETITQPGALIRIKAPRQMGKTSLMARILHHGAQQGYCTVSLSLQLADGKVFSDLDLFLRWFCASIGRRLKLPNRIADDWDEIFGSKDNCTAYFEEYLLENVDQPLVLGLDEVDRLFEYPAIAADVLGLLRAWHEDAKNREIWRKLRLVVVHSTEAYIPMDLNQSPFNVGLPVELPELNRAQVSHLAELHGLPWRDREVAQLMEMVGGHPYLVRVALYYLALGDLSLSEFRETAPTEAGLYRDHLRRHLWHLEHYPQLAEAMEDAIASPEPARIESRLAFKLQSLGLVRLQGNDVKPSYRLYREYFRDRFGTS